MNEPIPFLEKVTGFVTRPGKHGLDLLLFKHPNAGVQIPAGTVEEGEALEKAVLREVAEETGITATQVVGYIGWRDELPPGFTHVICHNTTVYSRPDPSSFDWASLPRGIAVCWERAEGEYAQVTYVEGDRYPDPAYNSYQITGWVPLVNLALTNRRHFFHLSYTGSSPVSWATFSDHHRFMPFWASLAILPEINPAQRAWLDFVQNELHYRF